MLAANANNTKPNERRCSIRKGVEPNCSRGLNRGRTTSSRQQKQKPPLQTKTATLSRNNSSSCSVTPASKSDRGGLAKHSSSSNRLNKKTQRDSSSNLLSDFFAKGARAGGKHDKNQDIMEERSTFTSISKDRRAKSMSESSNHSKRSNCSSSSRRRQRSTSSTKNCLLLSPASFVISPSQSQPGNRVNTSRDKEKKGPASESAVSHGKNLPRRSSSSRRQPPTVDRRRGHALIPHNKSLTAGKLKRQDKAHALHSSVPSVEQYLEISDEEELAEEEPTTSTATTIDEHQEDEYFYNNSSRSSNHNHTLQQELWSTQKERDQLAKENAKLQRKMEKFKAQKLAMAADAMMNGSSHSIQSHSNSHNTVPSLCVSSVTTSSSEIPPQSQQQSSSQPQQLQACHERQVESLRSRNDELNRELECLREQNTQLKLEVDENAELKREFEEFERQQQELEEAFEAGRAQQQAPSDDKDMITTSSSDNNTTSKEGFLHRGLNCLRMDNTQLQREAGKNAELRREFEECERQQQQPEEQERPRRQSSRRRQKRAIVQELEDLRNENSKLILERNETLARLRASEERQQSQRESQFKAIQEELESSELLVEDLRDQLLEHEAESKKHRGQLKLMNKHQTQLEEQQQLNKEIQRELESSELLVEDLQLELPKLQDEIKDLNDQIRELKKISLSDKNKIETLNRQIEKEKEAKKILKGYTKDMEEQKNKIKRSHKKEIQELQKQLSREKSRATKLNDQSQDAEINTQQTTKKETCSEIVCNDESIKDIDDEENWQVKAMDLKRKIPYFALYESMTSEKACFLIPENQVKLLTKKPVLLFECNFQLHVDISDDVKSFMLYNSCSNFMEEELVCISVTVMSPASEEFLAAMAERLESRLISLRK